MSLQRSKGIRDTQQAMAVIVDGLSQQASAEAEKAQRYERVGRLPGHTVLVASHIAAKAEVSFPRIRNFGRA